MKSDKEEKSAEAYEKPQGRELGDMFDVMKETTIVNSQISTMNPDFTLSDLHPDLLANPVIEYVRGSLSIVEIIDVYLPQEGDLEHKKNIKAVMLNKVYSLVVLSRSPHVLRAITEFIKGQRDVQTATPIESEAQERKLAPGGKINPVNWVR